MAYGHASQNKSSFQQVLATSGVVVDILVLVGHDERVHVAARDELAEVHVVDVDRYHRLVHFCIRKFIITF